MFMDMMIRLPRGTASSPLRIPSFSLTLSGVDIIVDDLTDGVILDVIQLVSDKAFITVDVSHIPCCTAYIRAKLILDHSQSMPGRLWCIPLKVPFVALSTYPVT